MPRPEPTSIGRFVVTRSLGRGGMGAVFLARDPVIDRLVAIKLIREGFSGSESRAQFTREAQSIGRLHHPNIVTVFDVGEHDGEPFIAMEYVEGDTLARLIAHGHTPLDRKLQIVDEVCAGLHCAHRNGIVHRDVKPTNIMVNTEGTAKILDFGVARGLAAESPGGDTLDGKVIGTLNYMSPEQIGGRNVDHRSDIFAMGAVLYELLSGRQAFPGDISSGVINLILTDGPEPLQRLLPGMDSRLVDIVERCLQRDANERYADAGRLRQDLAAIRARLAASADAGLAYHVRRQPAPPEALRILDAARSALSREDFAAAAEGCRQVLAIDRENVDALDLLERVRVAARAQEWFRNRDDEPTVEVQASVAVGAGPASLGPVLRGPEIFISYAQTPSDTTLAKYLAERLRKANFTVWLDEPWSAAGRSSPALIEQAITRSTHGVFIVSPSWLQREPTAAELDLFAARTPGARCIPIFRALAWHVAMPPFLARQRGFSWLEDDPDYDARFWELYCAISAADPGRPETWSRRGREIAPLAAPVPPAARRPAVRPSLKCNRTRQWTTVDDLTTDGFNDLILLPGGAGQGHDHFVERIQWLLRADPPRSIVRIDWPGRPGGREEFLERLAHALQAPVTSLAQEIATRLAHQNLVLLHPCVRARFVDQSLVRYYTEWLPELLARSWSGMHLKVVQPVEWPRDSRPVERLLMWMRLRFAGDQDGRAQAKELIRRVCREAAPVLRVVQLDELEDITDRDLVNFCELVDLKGRQRDWFLARIRSRNPTRATDVFVAIDDYLPEARGIS